jgi:hypothetical protein
LADERGTVSTLDLRSGQTTAVAKHTKNVTSLAIAPDGSIGASGDANGDLLLWPTSGAGGAGEKLRDDTRRDPIVFLGFSSPSTLAAVTQDLRIVVWDVSKKRTLRRGTVQLEALGREAEFSAAGVDPGATQLALASQYIAAATRRRSWGSGDFARPDDLKRTNVIVPYALESGLAGDPIQLGDFLAERLSMSPGSCWAVFSSNYRNQARMHVWSMVKQGQDLLRIELPARPTAVQLDPAGRTLAVGFPTGEVRTWRASGTTASDCATLRAQGPSKSDRPGPSVEAGTDATPLFAQGTGLKIAVLRFEAGGVEAFLGDAVGGMISGDLANSPSVVVIERAAIRQHRQGNAIAEERADRQRCRENRPRSQRAEGGAWQRHALRRNHVCHPGACGRRRDPASARRASGDLPELRRGAILPTAVVSAAAIDRSVAKHRDRTSDRAGGRSTFPSAIAIVLLVTIVEAAPPQAPIDVYELADYRLTTEVFERFVQRAAASATSLERIPRSTFAPLVHPRTCCCRATPSPESMGLWPGCRTTPALPLRSRRRRSHRASTRSSR